MSDEFETEISKAEVKNVFQILQGGREDATPTQPATPPSIPQNTYCIEDINGREYFHDGFLVFTSHHIAIMEDTPVGALPVFIMPLDRVWAAELVEDEVLDEDRLPF